MLGVRIEYVFLSKTPKSKGKDVWGRAKKISGLPAFLASGADPKHLPESYEDQPPDFFVIEISEAAWKTLKPKAKRALVDKSLCSCDIQFDEETGGVDLAIVGPDVAEFEAVLRRHGLWNESVKEFVEVAKLAEQLDLHDAIDELRGSFAGAEVSVSMAKGGG